MSRIRSAIAFLYPGNGSPPMPGAGRDMAFRVPDNREFVPGNHSVVMNRAIFALLGLLAFAGFSHAQSPADFNEGARLIRASDGTHTFEWWGRAGTCYFVQQSDDLINWSYLPVIKPGSDQVVEWNFISSADRLFLLGEQNNYPVHI